MMSARKKGGTRRSRITTLNLGMAFVMIALLASVGLFQKQRLATSVRSGESITVEFSDAHRLRAFNSDAKIAGVGIGVVMSVRRQNSGLTEVTLKVDKSALEAMGTTPSAALRPATLLGGNYYVDITPGGRRGAFAGTIPLERTKLPVELDSVTAALPQGARQGIRSSVSDLNKALDKEGSDALRDLVVDAPDTLDPMAGALEGARGTKPEDDLRGLVNGLESTSRVLSQKQGQLDGIVADLAKTSAILSDRRYDTTAGTADMPQTLDRTETLLKKFHGTLVTLKTTAGPARPSVQALDELLEDLDPVILEARPVVKDLRSVLTDARPLVEDLVPTTRNLTGTLDNVRGPVLQRVNGPIMDTVLSPWRGTGDYAGGGADRPFYKEVGYAASNLAQANMVDQNGSMMSFFPGVGPSSVAGLPISLEQLFSQLSTQAGAQQ